MVAHAVPSSTATASFPAMVHRMLTDIDDLKENDPTVKIHEIVSWLPDGRAFMIHDREKFTKIAMPIWFVRLKHTSWIRQLNQYGFVKVQDGTFRGALYHEEFVRGDPERAAKIGKSTKRKSSSSSSTLKAMIPRCTSANSPITASYVQNWRNATGATTSPDDFDPATHHANSMNALSSSPPSFDANRNSYAFGHQAAISHPNRNLASYPTIPTWQQSHHGLIPSQPSPAMTSSNGPCMGMGMGCHQEWMPNNSPWLEQSQGHSTSLTELMRPCRRQYSSRHNPPCYSSSLSNTLDTSFLELDDDDVEPLPAWEASFNTTNPFEQEHDVSWASVFE